MCHLVIDYNYYIYLINPQIFWKKVKLPIKKLYSLEDAKNQDFLYITLIILVSQNDILIFDLYSKNKNLVDCKDFFPFCDGIST